MSLYERWKLLEFCRLRVGRGGLGVLSWKLFWVVGFLSADPGGFYLSGEWRLKTKEMCDLIEKKKQKSGNLWIRAELAC